MFQEEQLCYKPQGQKCASKELQLGGFDVSQNILKIALPPHMIKEAYFKACHIQRLLVFFSLHL